MANKHVHKYCRQNIGMTERVWRCADPFCNHWMPRHLEGTVIGRATICWECGEVTQIDNRTISMEKPVCYDCDPNTPKGFGEIDFDEATKQVIKEINKTDGA